MRRLLPCLALLAILSACAAQPDDFRPEPSPAPLPELFEEASPTEAEIPPTAQHVPDAPWTPYGPGTLGVGTDIPAGEYILLPLSEDAAPSYELIDRVLEGAGCSLAFNSIRLTGCAIVTLDDLQRIRLTDCYAVPFDQLLRPVDGDEGMFRVGDHLPPGEYVLQAEDGAVGVVEVSRDSLHNTGSSLLRREFTGEETVTVEAGQYLTLEHCTVTRRPA